MCVAVPLRGDHAEASLTERVAALRPRRSPKGPIVSDTNEPPPGAPPIPNLSTAALFAAIERTVEQTGKRRVQRLPLHINDPAFAKAAAEAFLSVAQA